ncbi:hypothetical protein KR52_08315 [Synechococcus sp. KORDI-52]|nr:hypothetical protein KR52_08315 [Synechococcus sp. KORDI-52]
MHFNLLVCIIQFLTGKKCFQHLIQALYLRLFAVQQAGRLPKQLILIC